MDPTILILMLTAIFALLGFAFIIAIAIVNSNNNSKGNSSSKSSDVDDISTVEISAPDFQRISPKSLCNTALSFAEPTFKNINHPIKKLNDIESFNKIISTNHWLSECLYMSENHFNVYPYFGTINKNGLTFAWPNKSSSIYKNIINKNKNNDDNDQNIVNKLEHRDLLCNSKWGPTIEIKSLEEEVLSYNVVDIDALIGTVIWQYRSTVTNKLGSLTIPLAKGSPFITAEVKNIGISLNCKFKYILEDYRDKYIYILRIDESSGYLLILSKSISISEMFNIIYIPKFSGIFRIGYFNSHEMFDILLNHYNIYPIESTISSTIQRVESEKINSWNVDTTFQWTIKKIYDDIDRNTDNELIMIALPHHNIINAIFESSLIEHYPLGPFRFIITKDNKWVLADAVANYEFPYPKEIILQKPENRDIIKLVWQNELINITNSFPQESINWCKWMGSIATLILIGDMLDENITNELNILKENLLKIRTGNGFISNYNTFVYDNTWGGIIGNLGINDQSGNVDDGNAYYKSHIGQYGYLVFSFAVVGYFDKSFINDNKDIALLFARDIVNPYEYDNYFPMWRNKDWYFGYSISSGLSYYGRETNNIGELIFGYYSTYLLSLVIDNKEELQKWSITMLAHEISSLHHYFQFISQKMITVDQKFIQGTISTRGDTYYSYTTDKGNILYPERTAEIITSLIKPISLISFDYINKIWAKFIQPLIVDAIKSKNTEPEYLGYALAILSIENTKESKIELIQNVITNHNIYLPYGSTWSSILYWILHQ